MLLPTVSKSFFLSYVNVFQKCLKFSDPNMFPDNANMFMQSDNLHYLYNEAQLEMKNIHQWTITNKLSISISETKCVFYNPPRSSLLPHIYV